MNTIGIASAAVTGARHLRVGRNGQDAAAAWFGGRPRASEVVMGAASRASGAPACGAIVVCDGCSAGAHSEVGARLASQLLISQLARRLAAGEAPTAEMWGALRAELVGELGRIAEGMAGDRELAVHDHFLFTIVAAAWQRDVVSVWALGDGAYALGDRVCTLGPFDDNQPPYLGYELLGTAHAAHVVTADASCGSVIVATDGIVELGVDAFVGARALDRYLAHPDALRRQLVVRARGNERVDWELRRIDRQPAELQDDGAIAVMRWA